MAHKANAEQAKIVDAFRSGGDTVVIAGAGTGKTSTVELVAKAMSNKRILVVYFNAAAAKEGQARFPRHVTCKTSHGMTGLYRQYASRMEGGRVPSWKLAKVMGYQTLGLGGGERMVPAKVASLVRRTVSRFCYSDALEVGQQHVPWLSALGPEQNDSLREQVMPLAVAAWQDVMAGSGNFPFDHDCYLKIYQLGQPRLNYDVIILDEAQDTNPCVADIIVRQQGKAQLGMVGDPNQAIYEWRGAKNAMDGFEAENRLMLTGSYRFGPAVADQANVWLEMLGTDLRLKGYKRLMSEVTDRPLDDPTAILCRGNAGVIAEAMRAIGSGKKVAIAGGTGPLFSLARGAANLIAGAATDHPDLVAFQNWGEVRQYVKEEREDAGSLAPLVRIVDDYGTEAIIEMCNRVVDDRKVRPDLTISTAHKAKGLEWESVQIGPDFVPPKPDSSPRPEELRLSYVGVTRAKLLLGLGSLNWPAQQAAAKDDARETMGLQPVMTGSADDVEEQERLGAFLAEPAARYSQN